MKFVTFLSSLLLLPSLMTFPQVYGATPQAPETARANPSPGPPQHGNAREFMPAAVTKSSECKPNGANPDPACTPGAVMGISEDVVCNDSTKGRRAVTTRMKNQVYTDYAVASHPRGAYEIDHFIPLELGGSNDIANLWPQPARPAPGFHEKDKVETLCTTRSAKPTR
jgi:hypothetical protein